jgi:hypothetical protein
MAVGEWDQRQLCPDGGCVGVIGPDGTCKVCGHAAPNWGDERKRGLIDPPDEDGEDEDEDEDEDDEDEDEDEDDDEDDDAGDEATDEASDDDRAASNHALAASEAPSDWASRELCPDGSCIGVIGPDGTCKVCGRAAPKAPHAAASEPAAARPARSDPSAPPAEPASLAAEPASPAAEPASLAAELASPAAEPASPAAEPSSLAAATAGDQDTAARARCSDATCPGVRGPDGHCEVCGKVVA